MVSGLLGQFIFSFVPVSSVFLFVQIVLDFIGFLLQGFSKIVSLLVTNTIEMMLFFPPPGDLTPQTRTLSQYYWGFTFPVFWVILVITGSGYFVLMQLFPESDNASLDRFAQRVFIAVAMIIIVGYGFDFVVEFHNIVGKRLFPDTMFININMDTWLGIGKAALTGLSIVLLAFLMSPKILITYAMFLLMLGMRMVVVYATYGLFPILIGLWIVDIGPFKYAKTVSGYMFKACLLLLAFGIFISGILGVGGAVAGAEAELQQFGNSGSGNVTLPDQQVDGNRTAGGVLKGENPSFSAPQRGVVMEAMISVFTFFATIWVVIVITSTILGGSVSTGLNKRISQANKHSEGFNKIKDRLKERGEEGDSKMSDALEKSMNSIDKAQNLEDKVKNAPDNIAHSKTANKLTRGASSEIKDSADNAIDWSKDIAKGLPADAKEKAKGVANDFDEDMNDMADLNKRDMERKGMELGQAVDDKTMTSGLGKTGELGSKAGGKAGGIGGLAMGAMAKTAGKGAKAPFKAGSLAKRGGSAYWDVFKQPGIGNSVGRAKEIAQDSPILKPSEPDEKGAPEVDHLSADDLDMDTHSHGYGNTGGYEKAGGTGVSSDEDEEETPEWIKDENDNGDGNGG